MKGITVFETFTDIRDDYIRDAELDAGFTAIPARKREKSPSAFGQFMNSGWGVAIICALVAVSVMGGIIWAGFHAEDLPPVAESGQEPNETILPTTDDLLETDTEEIVSSIPTEGLIFKSNGDGTCYLQSIGGCTDEIIVIPAVSPEGDTVTAIGTDAFMLPDPSGDGGRMYNIYVKRVELPDTVTEIQASAFSGCHALETINLPQGLQVIEERAFSHCWALNNIELPSGLTTLGKYAFSCCTSLQRVTVPASVTIWGEESFYRCSALTELTLEEGLTCISRMAFAECTSLPYVKLPSTIQEIGSSAFYFCENLETIELTEGITKITGRAFSYCSGLKNVIIPSTVTVIMEYAFSDCTSLAEITIPTTVNKMYNQVFYRCSALTSATLLCDVEALGGVGIFEECIALSDVTLPESLTELSARTFLGCLSLKRITIPSSVHVIKKQFAADCTALEEIHYMGTKEAWLSSVGKEYKWNENTPNYMVHCTDGVLTKRGTEWTEEENGNVSYIEPGASAGLYFKSNGDGTCYVAGMGTCTDTRVVIPSVSPTGDRVVTIGLKAFYMQTELKEVVIPEGVTNMKESSFAYCTALETIILPSTITEIGESAFIGCNSLTEIDFGDSLENIGVRAFHICEELTTMTIPKTLKTIEKSALSFCHKLKIIHYDGTMAEWEEISKGEKWDECMGGADCYAETPDVCTTTVICSDGEIIIP